MIRTVCLKHFQVRCKIPFKSETVLYDLKNLIKLSLTVVIEL